jgi:ABC-type sulfate transport system substrate-binding protein
MYNKGIGGGLTCTTEDFGGWTTCTKEAFWGGGYITNILPAQHKK